MRRFAVVGHRAMSKGKLPLNDLAGAGGRMDVVVRALMAGLLTSHGLRTNTEVVLHLLGGPGPLAASNSTALNSKDSMQTSVL